MAVTRYAQCHAIISHRQFNRRAGGMGMFSNIGQTIPNTPEERVRTASIKPLLEQVLVLAGEYDIIQISPEQQKSSNAGFGYLFLFHDLAAKLGKEVGADWIIVGQHSKPSFLFSYLIVHVINAHTGKMVARFDIEMKGNYAKVTKRGRRKLSREIAEVIANLSASG